MTSFNHMARKWPSWNLARRKSGEIELKHKKPEWTAGMNHLRNGQFNHTQVWMIKIIDGEIDMDWRGRWGVGIESWNSRIKENLISESCADMKAGEPLLNPTGSFLVSSRPGLPQVLGLAEMAYGEKSDRCVIFFLLSQTLTWTWRSKLQYPVCGWKRRNLNICLLFDLLAPGCLKM